MHWADNFASQVIKRDKEEYIVESGITPSGIVHIGNVREILTQYFVYLAIKNKGKRAKFLYIWDDFDRFRKVPKGLDKSFENFIGMPVSKVPDPWKCHNSYAEHFKSKLVEEIKELKIETNYVSATELYQNCVFSENIKIALEKKDKIREILNKFRKEPLPENWLPIKIYCEKCWKDFTEVEYLGNYELKYKCICGFENKIDFRKSGIVKLKWRIDWPSRWSYFKVDFESSGKEHKSYGGSWDTSVLISREIYGYEPPIGPMYEYIYLKGQKEKMSSSKGNVITITDLLKIFEPSIIRYLYTQRLNKAIFIPFDLDIYNIYNEFDRCERIYFGLEEGKEEDKRKYELSCIEKYEKCPNRVAFSELVLFVQILPEEQFIGKVRELMEKRNIKLSELDVELIKERAKRAKYWVKNYAPENVKIKLAEEINVELTENQKEGIRELIKILKKDISTDELQKKIFEIAKKYGTDIFQISYSILIGKSHGPKLAYLIDAIGRDKVITRFSKIFC